MRCSRGMLQRDAAEDTRDSVAAKGANKLAGGSGRLVMAR